MNGHRAALPVDAQGQQLLGLAGAEMDRLPFHQHLKRTEGLEADTLSLPLAEELGPLHHVGDVLLVEGLEDHVIRLHPQGVHGEFGVGRGENDDHVGAEKPEPPGQLNAAHAGHVNIQQGEVHLVASSVFHGLGRVGKLAHDFKVRKVRALELEELEVQQHIIHKYGLHGSPPSDIITDEAYENRTLRSAFRGNSQIFRNR